MSSALVEVRELIEADRLNEAEAGLQRYHQSHPRSAAVCSLLAIVRIKQQRFDDALVLLKRAIARDPDVADFHHNIGAVYRVLGQFDAAERHYRTAIRLKPDYAEAYFNLSAARRFSADDPLLSAVNQQLRRRNLTKEDECFLRFAAGKLSDDAGHYQEAFQHYRLASQARGAEFDTREFHRLLDQITTVFSAELLESHHGVGAASELPVFVIGMPRSGTTLVEQILASHPDVFGAGELRDIPSISATLPRHTPDRTPYPQCVEHLEERVMRGFGQAYLQRVGQLGEGHQRLVDKLPQNFLFLGLIALLLPQARVIHCRRNPWDTCLSCYFQRFRSGQEYSYDLADLGVYYRGYERVMDHWRDVLTLPMLEVQYESLVAEPEPTIRQMVEFCGLPWTDDCLRFHQAKRPVTTASNRQVRRPMYRSSVERWRNYASELSPLGDALGKTLPAQRLPGELVGS